MHFRCYSFSFYGFMLAGYTERCTSSLSYLLVQLIFSLPSEAAAHWFLHTRPKRRSQDVLTDRNWMDNLHPTLSNSRRLSKSFYVNILYLILQTTFVLHSSLPAITAPHEKSCLCCWIFKKCSSHFCHMMQWGKECQLAVLKMAQ